MKVSVSELSGPALDWAVAKCEGEPASIYGGVVRVMHGRFGPDLNYSTDWSQGGPIIEREGISICPHTLSGWAARIAPPPYCNIDDHFSHGPTPLIAAMRCYVASKLGSTVDIPSELI